MTKRSPKPFDSGEAHVAFENLVKVVLATPPQPDKNRRPTQVKASSKKGKPKKRPARSL